MQARAIRATIRPYSTIVAPSSCATNDGTRAMSFDMGGCPVWDRWGRGIKDLGGRGDGAAVAARRCQPETEPPTLVKRLERLVPTTATAAMQARADRKSVG